MKSLTKFLARLFLILTLAALPWGKEVLAYGGSTISKLGVYTTDNVASLTITGFCNAFNVCGSPSLTINGSTSGGDKLVAPAVAGTTTLTLPGATDTLVGRATTDTLTNKTLTTATLNNPVITGPAPVACGSTCSPTAGQLILLNQAAGSTATLPTASGTGNIIRFRISVATTSAAEKILLTTTSDTIIGTAIGENAGTAKVFVGNAGTYHSIQMPFTGSEPSGGFIGDLITCTDIASGIWACDVTYQAGTTPTTPYSTSTS